MNITTFPSSFPTATPNLKRWALATGLAGSLLMAPAMALAGARWSVGVGAPGVAVQVRGGHGGSYGGHGGYHSGGYYRGYHGNPYGGFRGGYGWGRPGWSAWGPAVGIGIGIGFPLGVYEVEREPVYVTPAPILVAPPPVPSAPDPVVYPRNSQTPQQAEVDRRACDRWATTQPAAMADASIFHRSVEACMDARGYTIR